MSIKAFHIFFIICAVIISLLFAVWAITKGDNSASSSYFFAGCLSFGIALGLGCYGVFFIRKAKLS
ncbi:MAG: hypothetical protein JNN05_08530 [Candidatus Omnitrophica bacterium]|nr:hypothetical protein [Candidatus Omnitrophota bacterium]